MEEVLVKTENVSVRILELEAEEKMAWHNHSEVTDYIFALDGEIAVQMRSPDEKVVLAPGERCEVSAGRVHRVVNMRKDNTKYLLIQGVGRYDFKRFDSRQDT
jgi:quercetin dioxygenase-like cupin family protein